MKKPKTLPSTKPNAGLAAQYARRLEVLITRMHIAVRAALLSKTAPRRAQMAQDAGFVEELRKTLRKLGREWERKFEAGGKELAEYFAKAVHDRSDRNLKAILRRAGYSVRFRLTEEQRRILNATIQQNVTLIKSIQQQYMTAVEGDVMRSVQSGRNLEGLSRTLQKSYGVSKRRAQLISRDQNNKATAALTRNRRMELGISKAIWVHSGAGKEPRPSHVAAGRRRQVFDVDKGWYDPHEKKWIQPGELINCRCTSRAIIPGFD